MITVYYHPEQGVVLPDALMEPYVTDLIMTHWNTPELFEIQVGSEQILMMFRVVMMENKIPPDSISFMAYNIKTKSMHHVYIMDKSKNYSFDTYDHFYNIIEDSLMRILQW